MGDRIVSAAVSAVLACGIAAVSPVFGQSADAGLKDVYAKHFRFGSILNGSTVNSAAMKQIVLREFNSITPENELKPDQTIVQSGSTNDNVKVQLGNGAKAILKFCEDNNIPVRGHTLVWHSQTPGWFFRENFNASGAVVSKDVMDKRMESYIKNMFAVIKDNYPKLNLYAYDVVNEAASDAGKPRTPGTNAGDGQSMWVQVYGGNSFVEKAFTYARRYAPAATKLFYNDYNEYMGAKMNYIADSIVKPLYNKKLLDGMGMQSHLDLRQGGNPFPTVSDYGNAIKKYKDIGVEVHVTELDVCMDTGYYNAQTQATYYKNIMNEILTKGGTAVKAVVVWGIQDDQSWRKAKKPLLFNDKGQKKAAYNEVYNLIPKSDWGDGNNIDGGKDTSGGTTPVAAPVKPAARAMPLITVRDRTVSVFSATDAAVKINVADMRGKTVTNLTVRGGGKVSLKTLPAGAYVVEAKRQDGYKAAVTAVLP